MSVRFQYLVCTRSTLHALPFGVSTGRGEGRVARRHARAETGDRGVAAVWQQCLGSEGVGPMAQPPPRGRGGKGESGGGVGGRGGRPTLLSTTSAIHKLTNT